MSYFDLFYIIKWKVFEWQNRSDGYFSLFSVLDQTLDLLILEIIERLINSENELWTLPYNHYFRVRYHLIQLLTATISLIFVTMFFSDPVCSPGRRAEESYPSGVCQQAGHGPGNDAHRGGQRSGPSRPQRQKMADLQDLRYKGHRPGWGNGMVGFTILYRETMGVNDFLQS